ncbi:hypothetical protein CWI37_0012p0060 [Hamiltosporidium tvaerminnensis]|uniref:Uncharacterized protein n=1 Tax=Hamiltosporidium tvaerminnensis TaxID=1176355 RepID=A0A4Q9LC55_9MICR|nr:hypothetical protein CWI37_0012p0060 [Hamiltosporidium tvaerminnensis]
MTLSTLLLKVLIKYYDNLGKRIFKKIQQDINKKKSATNDACHEDTTTILEGVSVYKYLEIVKDSRSNLIRSSLDEIPSKLMSRFERVRHTRLNANNLFSAKTQHAISLKNNHMDIVRLNAVDYSKLDEHCVRIGEE